MTETLQQSSAAFTGARYHAGDLTIDSGRQRVVRAGEEIPLPKLSFDLLLALVRAAPNVVSLEGLMHEVWPNLVVSPETVSQRVKLLRHALGDDPRKPRYIAGLRGRGYRLVAPVTHVEQAPATEEPVRTHARSRFRSLVHSRWVAVGLLASLAFLGGAAVALRMVGSSRHESVPPSAVMVSALPERSVAVLPFESRSKDEQDEFVALGVAEGVLHRLAGIRGLTVIARSSSFGLAGNPADAREIGLKLNARYLVDGSVQRSGDRLRVTAQLIDAAQGSQVWSLRFDRSMADVFAAEDEISQGVARALEVSLTETEHPYARFGTDAYLAFMQGKALMATRTVADADRAIERFAQATQLAPQFAAAYVALAEAYIHRVNLTKISTANTAPDETAAYSKAQSLLERALRLDGSLGEAYVLRAELENYAGNLSAAEADYRKGLVLSPNYGRGYESFANFLADQHRTDEALAAIDRARAVDPLTPRNHYLKGLMLHAQAAWRDDAIKEAEALYLQALQIAPEFHPALARLATIRAYPQGRFAEAVKLAEQAVAIDPRSAWLLIHPVTFYLEAGDVDAARQFVMAQTESLRPGLWLPVCVFEREPQRAADIMRANPDRWTDVFGEDIEAYAIRDAAVADGQPERAREELPRLPQTELRGLYRTTVLAQINSALGNRPEAERLAHRVLEWKEWTLPGALGTSQAIALALLGQLGPAMDRLEQTYEQGWGRHRWYVLEREPAFDALRGDPRFQALLTRARAHAAAERALLDQMRARGDVPRRTAPAGVEPIC